MKTDLRVSLSYMRPLQTSFLNFIVNPILKALQDPSELSIFLQTPLSPWHFQVAQVIAEPPRFTWVFLDGYNLDCALHVCIVWG